MAGIYIHIPFCRQACSYCNFHFSTQLKHQDLLVNALVRELEIRAKDWQDTQFNTVYFGGGTPSVLSITQVEKLFKSIAKHYQLASLEEFTLEANPDDITLEKLQAWKSLGIHRLSLGIQSFRDEDLQLLNRSHSNSQSFKAIELAQKAGFDKFNIDLIYGIPGLTSDAWKANLNQVAELGMQHLSAYALTVEEKTTLAYQVEIGKVSLTSDEEQAQHFKILQDWAQEKGYLHYELSNLALPGQEAIHNSNYWNNSRYLGIGPGAHGFRDNLRYQNMANNAGYLNSIAKGNLNQEVEKLSRLDVLNEKIMTGLRLAKGLNLGLVQELAGPHYNQLEKDIKLLLSKDLIQLKEGHICVKAEHRFLSDGIAAELFQV